MAKEKSTRCFIFPQPARYSKQHDTPFSVEAEGKVVFDAHLASFVVHTDGSDIVEPLLGIWKFSLITVLSDAKEVNLILAGQRFPAGQATISAMQEMVRYFSGKPGV